MIKIETKLMILKWKNTLLSKIFWQRNWKKMIAAAMGIVAVVLIIGLLVGGQQDVGAKEAGAQLASLAQNIRNHYKTRPDFWGLSTAEVINKKVYPLNMTVSHQKLTGYFGNQVEVGADMNGTAVMPTVRQFAITYKDLSKQQCIGLAAHKFDQKFWLGVSGMMIANQEGNHNFDWSSKDFMLPAAKEKVKKLCNSINNVVFYFE